MIALTPHAQTRHWAASYVGLPWVAGALGPDAFDCWGLVRHVQKQHHGRDLAHLQIAADVDQWRTVREIVQASGWRRVADTPREGDVVLMLNWQGRPHVGTAVQAQGLRLLHAMESHGVQIDRIDDLGRLRLGHLQCWRRA